MCQSFNFETIQTKTFWSCKRLLVRQGDGAFVKFHWPLIIIIIIIIIMEFVHKVQTETILSTSWKQHIKQCWSVLSLLLARLMGLYCFARWRRLSSFVTQPAGVPTGRRARGRSGGRHCTAGQYGYVSLGRRLVTTGSLCVIPDVKEVNRQHVIASSWDAWRL